MSSEIDTASSTNVKEDIELSSTENLFRIRKNLLILVTIQWIACLIGLAVNIYSAITENEQDTISTKIESLIPLFALILYYTCGLLFIYKYNRIGILIFASIGIVLFVITMLFIIYLVLVLFLLAVGYSNLFLAFQFFAIVGLIVGAFATVAILTLKLALKLAKLIKTNGYSIV